MGKENASLSLGQRSFGESLAALRSTVRVEREGCSPRAGMLAVRLGDDISGPVTRTSRWTMGLFLLGASNSNGNAELLNIIAIHFILPNTTYTQSHHG